MNATRPAKIELFDRFELWIPVYLILLGLAYQTGYWGVFNVDVMAYLGLDDVVKLSIVPLGTTLPVLAVPTGILMVYAHRRSERLDNLLRKKWVYLPLLSSVVIGVVALFWNVPSPIAGGRSIVPLIWGALSGVTAGRAYRAGWLGNRFSPFVQAFAITLLFSSPAISWGLGSSQALKVLRGDRYKVMNLPPENQYALHMIDSKELRYLGHVNDYDFVLNDRVVLVIRSDTISGFSLREVRRPFKLLIPFVDPRIPDPKPL